MSGPEVWQNGSAAELQAKLVALPKLPLHPVHVPVPTSHTGVAPVHADELDTVHTLHAPLIGPTRLQSGAAEDGQARVAALPKSPLQGSQWLWTGSQTGSRPEQWLLLSHSPQAPVFGPAVTHRVVPGKPAHCKSVAHASHTDVLRLQMGVFPLHAGHELTMRVMVAKPVMVPPGVPLGMEYWKRTTRVVPESPAPGVQLKVVVTVPVPESGVLVEPLGAPVTAPVTVDAGEDAAATMSVVKRAPTLRLNTEPAAMDRVGGGVLTNSTIKSMAVWLLTPAWSDSSMT